MGVSRSQYPFLAMFKSTKTFMRKNAFVMCAKTRSLRRSCKQDDGEMKIARPANEWPPSLQGSFSLSAGFSSLIGCAALWAVPQGICGAGRSRTDG